MPKITSSRSHRPHQDVKDRHCSSQNVATELVQPRKGHRKSRQGCYDCKRRKIKCQETLPACENCVRSSLQCRYFSHVAAANISPEQTCTLHETQIFNLTDMRLFHHYLVAAYPHIPVRNDNIWIVYITPIAHQRNFLMHALLSLAASHLNKLSSSGLTAVAQSHRLSAIKGLNEVLEKPINSPEQGDAILATCYALLMQSWYMDDGLPAFLVLTRSCDAITQHIQSLKVGSLLAEENTDTRVENMRARLKTISDFNIECIRSALASLNTLAPLCQQVFEKSFWTALQDCFISLAKKPIEAYKSYLEIEKSLIRMDYGELEQLLDPRNTISQLLLAHLVALQLIMRPISCNERKIYTVTMYGIRMTAWMNQIYAQMSEEYQDAFKWPLLISQLHEKKRLTEYAMISKTLTLHRS